jgi:hypothetical protein
MPAARPRPLVLVLVLVFVLVGRLNIVLLISCGFGEAGVLARLWRA